MHFPATSKFQSSSLQCLPWGHPMEPLNKANRKESEPLGKNGYKHKCLDRSLKSDKKKQDNYNEIMTEKTELLIK